jgi:hypothetical protein
MWEAAVLTNSSDTPMWMSRGADAVVGSGQGIQPRQKVTVKGTSSLARTASSTPATWGRSFSRIDKYTV